MGIFGRTPDAATRGNAFVAETASVAHNRLEMKRAAQMRTTEKMLTSQAGGDPRLILIAEALVAFHDQEMQELRQKHNLLHSMSTDFDQAGEMAEVSNTILAHSSLWDSYPPETQQNLQAARASLNVILSGECEPHVVAAQVRQITKKLAGLIAVRRESFTVFIENHQIDPAALTLALEAPVEDGR